LTAEPTKHDHALIVPKENIVIPLDLKGVDSTFPTRMPTTDEMESPGLRHIELTASDPEWDPHSTEFAERECALIDDDGKIHQPVHVDQNLFAAESLERACTIIHCRFHPHMRICFTWFIVQMLHTLYRKTPIRCSGRR